MVTTTHILRATAPIALSCAEVARRLGCSAETVRRQVHAGEIPRLPHVGARILVPTRWLDQIVEEAMAAVEATT